MQHITTNSTKTPQTTRRLLIESLGSIMKLRLYLIGALLFFSLTGRADPELRMEALDVEVGHFKFLDLNRYSKGGAIEALVLVEEFRPSGSWTSIASVGIIPQEHNAKVEVFLAHTGSERGVVMGYRHFNESEVFKRKILFHGVPEGHLVPLRISWDVNGVVAVQFQDKTETLNTKFVRASGYVFGSGVKAKYSVAHYDE